MYVIRSEKKLFIFVCLLALGIFPYNESFANPDNDQGTPNLNAFGILIGEKVTDPDGIRYIFAASTNENIIYQDLDCTNSDNIRNIPIAAGLVIVVDCEDDQDISEWHVNVENFPSIFFEEVSLSTDSDSDFVPDVADNCPVNPNSDQADTDDDNIGDVCDTDNDGDGISDNVDNCPTITNTNQLDSDSDGLGDVCDQNPTLSCGQNTIQIGFQCVGTSAQGFMCGDGTLEDLIQGKCFPNLNEICGQGTIISGMQCIAQTMGSMIGGTMLEIDNYSLLVGIIGYDPVITGLVGITIAGLAGQVAWYIHKKKKS